LIQPAGGVKWKRGRGSATAAAVGAALSIGVLNGMGVAGMVASGRVDGCWPLPAVGPAQAAASTSITLRMGIHR
jgi:hypothetical protein